MPQGDGNRDSGEVGSFRWAARWSLGGAAVTGGLFLAVSVVRTLTAGGALLDHLGPTLAMTVIGATVGGLVGPLVGGGIARRRGSRDRADEPGE